MPNFAGREGDMRGLILDLLRFHVIDGEGIEGPHFGKECCPSNGPLISVFTRKKESCSSTIARTASKTIVVEVTTGPDFDSKLVEQIANCSTLHTAVPVFRNGSRRKPLIRQFRIQS